MALLTFNSLLRTATLGIFIVASPSCSLLLQTPQNLTSDANNDAPTFSISGEVILSSFTGDPSSVEIRIKLFDEDASNVILNTTTFLTPNSEYSLTGLPPGSYAISIKPLKRFLLARIDNIIIVNEDISNIDFTLINGDANGDNIIDAADETLLQNSWLTSSASPNWNEDVDFNGDGVINFIDYTIYNNGFNTSGDLDFP
jgi:hypothetical protein